MRFALGSAILLYVSVFTQPADAALLIEYDISVPSTDFFFGSSVMGSLTLDLDDLADPSDVTLAELNSLADYSITVSPTGTASFTEFTLTDENSTWSLMDGGTTNITATPTQLTFYFSENGFFRVALDTPILDAYSLDFAGGSGSIIQISRPDIENDVDRAIYGPQFPSFTFSGSPASVPEPSSLALLSLCGIGVAAARRRWT